VAVASAGPNEDQFQEAGCPSSRPTNSVKAAKHCIYASSEFIMEFDEAWQCVKNNNKKPS